MMRLRSLFIFTLLAVIVSGCAADRDRDRAADARLAVDSALRQELLTLAKVDQAEREGFAAAAAADDTAYLMRLLAADSARSLRLQEVVATLNGWPGASLVGEDGAEAAFLILQHSPSHEFQKQMLPLLREAARRGEAAPQGVALLTDRLLIHEGKPQRYGSQFFVMNGKLVLEPIEDEANVDRRRAEIGLPPIAEYLRLAEEMYQLSVQREQRE